MDAPAQFLIITPETTQCMWKSNCSSSRKITRKQNWIPWSCGPHTPEQFRFSPKNDSIRRFGMHSAHKYMICDNDRWMHSLATPHTSIICTKFPLFHSVSHPIKFSTIHYDIPSKNKLSLFEMNKIENEGQFDSNETRYEHIWLLCDSKEQKTN